MILNKPLIVQCNSCGEIIEISTDLDCVFSQERQMGTELEFQGIIDDECPNCSNNIYISIDAWEYPIGAVNYYSIENDGVELLEKPSLICEDFYNDD